MNNITHALHAHPTEVLKLESPYMRLEDFEVRAEYPYNRPTPIHSFGIDLSGSLISHEIRPGVPEATGTKTSDSQIYSGRLL